MPKPEQLPEDVRAITSKNALAPPCFDDDTENIVSAILGGSAKERAWEDRRTLRAKILYGVGGGIAAATFMFVVALLH